MNKNSKQIKWWIFAVVVFLAVVLEDFWAGLLVCFVVDVDFFFAVEELEPVLSEAL